jgi:hypothetical protein
VLNTHFYRRPAYCLVVAEFREKLLLSTREIPSLTDKEGFHLKKLEDVKVTEKCQIKISIKFVALENLDNIWVISRSWEYVKITSVTYL